MPNCRSAQPRFPVLEREPVRLSRYIVARRVPPRPANDNRGPRGTVWHWAVALAAAPALTVALHLSGMF